MKRLLIPACALLLLLTWHLARAASFIDEIEGVYVEKGDATIYPCQGCDLEPMKDATNCVVIKKESDKIARVYLNVVGENGHSCIIETEYAFEIRNDSLFHSDYDFEEPFRKDEGQPRLKTDGVYVFKDKDNIVFQVQPDRGFDFHCGITDYLDGYTISTALKSVPWKNGGPSKPLNQLDRYCPKFNWEY